MLSISILQLFLSVFVMSVSTETRAPCSRALKSLIGPLQKSNTVGNSMHTQDKHGLTPWLISTLNGLPCSLQANVKSLMFFSGSDLNSGVLVCQADSSTTKSLTQQDGDTVVTCSTIQTMSVKETEFFTLSLTLIRSSPSFSVLTQPLPKAVNSSRKSGTLFANLPPRFLRRMISSSHMKCHLRSRTSPTSDVSGNTTVSISSDLDSLNLLTRRRSLNLMLTLSANGSV